MLHNVAVLVVIVFVALVVSVVIGVAQKERFEHWWNAKGVPVFIWTFFALLVMALAFGWLGSVWR